MEEHIIDEINHLSQLLDTKEGQEIEFRTLFPISVSNNINSLNFGRRFEYTDSRRKAIDEFLILDPNFNFTGVFAFYPVATRFIYKYLPFIMPLSLRIVRDKVKAVTDIIRSEYETHVKTIDKNNNRDYLDAFICEMQKFGNGQHDDMLEGNSFLLIGAAGSTVLQTLEWSLLILATNPQIQQQIHKEIDEVIGKERSPKTSDKNQMPFLQAFMYEVWRFRTLLPINLPR
ncbi:unnamed protein product, partial [Medioppia subpectinata]